MTIVPSSGDLIKLAALLALYREPILRSAANNVNGGYQEVTDAFYRTAATSSVYGTAKQNYVRIVGDSQLRLSSSRDANSRLLSHAGHAAR